MPGSGTRLITRVVAAATLLCLVASACGDDDDASTSSSTTAATGATVAPATTGTCSSSKDTYKIGFAGDFTGPIANLGQPTFSGFKTYIEATNAAGGVNCRQIELFSENVNGDINQARIAVETLDRKGSLGMFGGLSGNIWGPLAELAAQYEMAHVTVGVTDDKVLPPQPYVYSMQIGAQTNAELAVQFLQKELGPGAHKIATLGFTSAYTQGYQDYLTTRVGQLGWTLVARETIPLVSTDASAAAEKVANAKPEAVLVVLVDAITALGVRALRDKGFTGVILNFIGGDSQATFKSLNDPKFYAIRSFLYPRDQTVPAAKTMVAQAEKAGTTDGLESTFFTNGYVQGMIAVEALKKCADPCDGKTYNTALESVGKLDVKDLQGDIEISKTRHRAPAAGRIFKWNSATSQADPIGDWIKTDIGSSK